MGTDSARSGTLAATLEDIARENGLDLGPVEAPSPDEASMVSQGRGIGVVREPDAPGYLVQFRGGRHLAAEGVADDLLAAAGAVDAWRAGTPLRDLVTRFSFLTPDGFALASEDGTGIDYLWTELLTDPDPIRVGFRPFYAAVGAHAVLGRFAPVVSMHSLLRLTMPLPKGEFVGIGFTRLDDQVKIEFSWEQTPRWDLIPSFAPTIEEAVSLAAAKLAAYPGYEAFED
jgi:hypothetical protein